MSRSTKIIDYNSLPTVVVVQLSEGVWIEVGRTSYTSFGKKSGLRITMAKDGPPADRIIFDPRSDTFAGSIPTCSFSVVSWMVGDRETFALMPSDMGDTAYLPHFRMMPTLIEHLHARLNREFDVQRDAIEAQLAVVSHRADQLEKENKELRKRVGGSTEGKFQRTSKRKIKLTQNR